MTQQNISRRQKLEAFLQQNPSDAFSRYGIALECLREGDREGAYSHFRKLNETNPDYVPGYQMFGQSLAEDERFADAKAILQQGIAAANRANNAHARSEMESLLANLP